MIAYKMVKDIYKDVEKVRKGEKDLFGIRAVHDKAAYNFQPFSGDFHIMPDGTLMRGRKHRHGVGYR